jgi:hypothetical protein
VPELSYTEAELDRLADVLADRVAARAWNGTTVVTAPSLDQVLSRPTTAKGQLQRAVLALLYEHADRDELPTNARFVFYELEQAGVVSKVRTGARRADQNTSEALTWLRDRGLVPWDWIVDETREVHDWHHAATARDYVLDSLERLRINPWGQPPPLIVCESRSLGGVLRPLAYEYVCPLAPTNGQCGGFLHTVVAPMLLGNDRRVLYLGDHDLSGDQIEANTRRVLAREAEREIDWRRVAITAEQITERGLTPILKADQRYRPPREHEAWETEALGQTTVTALVREALDALLPEPLSDVQEREQAQREAVAGFLAAWDGGSE